MNKLTPFFILLCAPIICYAWDGQITGKIAQIDVGTLDGDNRGFRIILENAPALCGNGNTWAYVNKSDDNYDATVSLLLAAKLGERSVTIFSDQNPSDGYCHIGYIMLY